MKAEEVPIEETQKKEAASAKKTEKNKKRMSRFKATVSGKKFFEIVRMASKLMDNYIAPMLSLEFEKKHIRIVEMDAGNVCGDEE